MYTNKMHKEHPRGGGGGVGNKYSNATVSYELKCRCEQLRWMLRLWQCWMHHLPPYLP